MDWISVKDRMPDGGQLVDIWVPPNQHQRVMEKSYKGHRVCDVNVVDKEDEEGEAYKLFHKIILGQNHGWVPENRDITHWMPLSEPPKE